LKGTSFLFHLEHNESEARDLFQQLAGELIKFLKIAQKQLDNPFIFIYI